MQFLSKIDKIPITQRIHSKWRTLVWFLLRPRLYPEMIRKISRSLKPPHFQKTQDNLRWCQDHAIPLETALERITQQKHSPSIRSVHPKVFDWAEKVARQCPVQMGGASALDLIYYLAKNSKASHVLETGVAYGWSSLAILLSNDSLKLVSIDMPYPQLNNEGYVGCVVPQSLHDRWNLIRLPDREGIPLALKTASAFDLIHYDSDKSYEGRSWAYPILWNALRDGGIFISDDIADNSAFKDFCHAFQLTPLLVKLDYPENRYLGILTKNDKI